MTLTNCYTTLTDVRNRVGLNDAVDDVTLEPAITGACRAIDVWCGQEFSAAQSATARYYVPKSMSWIKVDPFWTTTGLIVATDPIGNASYSTIWTSSDYELQGYGGSMDNMLNAPYDTISAVLGLAFPTWTRRSVTVKVTAQWGWSAVPQNVVEAAKILSVDLWKRKDTPFGIATGSIDFGPLRIGRDVMAQVASLLQPFRRMDRKAGVA